MPQKLVTVVGATGQQGQAVINAFLNNPAYRIRGLTRNPNSPGAQRLADQGIEVVKANVSDAQTVEAAFEGSHIIFAVTDFWELYQKHGAAKARELEYKQGEIMVKAASSTSTLEHLIWSTLPLGSKKYPVPHFESKSDVEYLVRRDPGLLAKSTFLMVCFYANNLQIASFRPYWIDTVGKYVHFTTYSPDVNIPFIGEVANVTPFVKAIVEKPEETKNGAVVIGSIAAWTAKQWVETWAAGKGAEVEMVRLSREQYEKLFPWPRWSDEFALMMDYFEFVPMSEWLDPAHKVLTAESLGVQPVHTMEEWAKAYELPDAKSSTI